MARHRTLFSVSPSRLIKSRLESPFLVAVRCLIERPPFSSLPREREAVVSHSILIVDDNSAIRSTLRSYLEQYREWSVCGEAENGQDALEKVKQLCPDVVLLDFQMPIMNGLDAARRITQLAPGTIMLMLTMHYSQELMKEAEAVGIKQVLSKSDAIRDHLLISLQTMQFQPDSV